MKANITALMRNEESADGLGFVMFWTLDTFDPDDYDSKYRICPSGVSGQVQYINGKWVDVSGQRHWVAEPEFAVVIKQEGAGSGSR